MSRSYRKPYSALCGFGKNGEAKRLARRMHRHIASYAVRVGKEIIPEYRETSDIWNFPSDGKCSYLPSRSEDKLDNLIEYTRK